MKILLDLPEGLLNEAMQVSQLETKTAVITHALEILIKKHSITDLKSYKGTLDLAINLDELRDRNRSTL